MDAQTQGRVQTSCPFADSRPDGCICIALREPKRVSVDYQARFCLTERHVQCRRFQRAVPEVPEAEAPRGRSFQFETGTFLIAGGLAIAVLLLAAAFTFRGTWSGWFGNSSAPVQGTQIGAVVTVQPTPIVLGGGADGDTPTPAVVPVFSASSSTPPSVESRTSTPAQTPTSFATPTPSPSPTPSPTATPMPSPTPSPATMTPTVTPSPTAVASTPTTYVVVRGDTLNTIAQAFGVSPALIAAANDLSSTDVIQAGATLFIPSPDGLLPDNAPNLAVHIVSAGDTLSAIAARFGVTLQNVMNANGITDANHIEPGQVIVIPRGDVAAPVPTPAPQITYTVQHGDTLYSIAKRFGVTVEDLMAANGLTDRTYVVTGWVLIIPNS